MLLTGSLIRIAPDPAPVLPEANLRFDGGRDFAKTQQIAMLRISDREAPNGEPPSGSGAILTFRQMATMAGLGI